MRLLVKVAFFCALALGTILLTACPSSTSISKINGDPARYKNKDVAVVGPSHR